MEKMKTIYHSTDSYAEKSFIDEKNSCICVPVGKQNNFDQNDYFLLGNKIESKYPNFKFTGFWKDDNGTAMFFYKKSQGK
jgi:hypothetical protein